MPILLSVIAITAIATYNLNDSFKGNIEAREISKTIQQAKILEAKIVTNSYTKEEPTTSIPTSVNSILEILPKTEYTQSELQTMKKIEYAQKKWIKQNPYIKPTCENLITINTNLTIDECTTIGTKEFKGFTVSNNSLSTQNLDATKSTIQLMQNYIKTKQIPIQKDENNNLLVESTSSKVTQATNKYINKQLRQINNTTDVDKKMNSLSRIYKTNPKLAQEKLVILEQQITTNPTEVQESIPVTITNENIVSNITSISTAPEVQDTHITYETNEVEQQTEATIKEVVNDVKQDTIETLSNMGVKTLITEDTKTKFDELKSNFFR